MYPVLNVGVHVDPSLRDLAAGWGAAKVRAAVADEVQALLRQLHVPAAVEVTIDIEGEPSDRWGSLSVGGRRCWHPESAPAQAAALSQRGAPGAEDRPGADGWWLEALRRGAARGSDTDRAQLYRWLRFLARGTLTQQLPRLLGPEQVAAFADEAKITADPGTLGDALRGLLAAGLSLPAPAEVRAALPASSGPALADWLLDARTPTASISMPQAYLRQLVVGAGSGARGILGFLRDALFEELGVRMPPIRVRTDESLPAHTFAISVNDVTLMPWPGLREGECFLNAPRTVALDRKWTVLREVDNPANGVRHTVIALDDLPGAEAEGYTAWKPLEFLVLAAAAELRTRAAWLVPGPLVNQQLDEWAATMPAAIRHIRSRLALPVVARALRSLVSERVTLRYPDLITSHLLDARMFAPGRPIEEYLREGLGMVIGGQSARGSSSIVAYLIDPELEELFDNGQGELTEQQQRGFLDAVDRELRMLPPGVAAPVVLTDGSRRARVARLLATEHPLMSVYGYNELPAGLSIQPVARLTAS